MIKQKLIRFVQVLGLVVLLSVPMLAVPTLIQAQSGPDLGLRDIQNTTKLPDWGIQQGSNQGASSVVLIITSVIKILLLLAGSIAILFIIIGGYQYITSGASPDLAKKGKTTVVNALVGIIIIVLSYVLVTVVSNLVSRQP